MAQMVTVVVDVLLSVLLASLLLLLLMMFFNAIPRRERRKNRFSFPLDCVRTSQATSHFEYICACNFFSRSPSSSCIMSRVEPTNIDT